MSWKALLLSKCGQSSSAAETYDAGTWTTVINGGAGLDGPITRLGSD